MRLIQQRIIALLESGIFALAFSLVARPLFSSEIQDPAYFCDQAAIIVARDTGIPLDILRAITRVETGRGNGDQMQPWPWTVNMEGHGVWFDTKSQAQVYVFRNFRKGARSFDVGCFQINYKWHGHEFDSIEEMFDPIVNARYAARFLRRLHTEHGDWNKAVGAYHSRTHRYAQRYLKRYAEIHRNLPDRPRQGRRQPLLRGQSAQSGNGSLVPISSGSNASLFTADRGM